MGYVDGIGILKMLRHRRRCLERALEGIGGHGMLEVETTPIGEEEIKTELMPMSCALHVELERMVSNCKKTSQKLHRTARSLSEQESNSALISPNKSSVFSTMDSGKLDKSATLEFPSGWNHQKLMNLTSSDIQVSKSSP